MKILLIIFLYLISITNSIGLENKIILKLDNEIITSIDIENEINYLKALNPQINNLNIDKLNNIAKNSLIREKVKEKEILNYVEIIKLKEDYLDQLIQQRYSRLNIKNRKEFLTYLKQYGLNIKTIENKISIEALWNQIIYQKFSKNIKISEDQLKKQIKKKFKEDGKTLLLSELVFKIDNKKDLKEKYSEILNTINKEGFESAALLYSISDSSSIGGKLGWIKQKSLNKSINNELSKLKIGSTTKPIFTPNGYLILKIDDIKYIEEKYDEETELNELIKLKTNQQLNQQSVIYFNKIKKNIIINEF